METSFVPEHVEELDSRAKLSNSRMLTRTKSGSFSQHTQIQELQNVNSLLTEPVKTPEMNKELIEKLGHLLKSRPTQRLRLRILKATKEFLQGQPAKELANNKEGINTLLSEVSKSNEFPKYTKSIMEIPRNKGNIISAEKLLSFLSPDQPDLPKFIAAARFWYTDTNSLLHTIRIHLRNATTDSESNQLFELTEQILATLAPDNFSPKFSPIVRSIAALGLTSNNQVLVKKGEQVLDHLRQIIQAAPEINDDDDPFSPPNDWFQHIKPKIQKGTYTDREVKYFAQDLKKRSMNLFLKIKQEEYARQNWSKNPDLSLNLSDYISDFNHISFFVVQEVLSLQGRHERAHAIGFFIKVADRLNSVNDFNSCMAIQAGLNMHCVDRLKQSWGFVEEQSLKCFSSLTEIYTPLHNFANIRALQKKENNTNHSVVPFLSLYLRDLTFADDGNPTFVEGKINIKKLELLGTLQIALLKIQRSCKSSTCFATDICKYIVKKTETEETLDRLSEQLEPPNHHKAEDNTKDHGTSTPPRTSIESSRSISESSRQSSNK